MLHALPPSLISASESSSAPVRLAPMMDLMIEEVRQHFAQLGLPWPAQLMRAELLEYDLAQRALTQTRRGSLATFQPLSS